MKRSICYIPSGEMLRFKPVSYWLGRFPDFTRRSATEVVLPAVGYSGPLFESRVQPVPPTYRGQDLLPQWVREARDLLGEAGTVWGNFIVEGGFLDNPALWQRNQYDQDMSQVCITHPAVRGVMHELISEAIETGLDGIVLDVTDAYPNAGSDAYQGISAHCFCGYCFEAMRLKGLREPREAFIGDDSILRLVLRVDSDGTSHIDPPQTWIDQRDSSALVALSLARRFVEGDRQDLESQAMRLLAYLRARVAVTADSIRAVLAPCRDANKRTAVVLGSADCDWAQMVTLEAACEAASADEYWLPDPPGPRVDKGVQLVQFLAGRSTYSLNSFFDAVETAGSKMILMGMNDFLALLMSVSKRLMNNRLSPGAAYIVENHLPEFAGFAGVPLGQQDHLDIIERLTEEVTGVVLPTELLMKFRIVEPSP
jgi:hypothetical protein